MNADTKLVIKSSNTSVAPDDKTGDGCSKESQSQPIINLDHGDPVMYESYWKKLGENFKTAIPVYQSLSYFANKNNLCWFLEPKLEEEIKTLHKLVGNATVEDRHIVVGTGSSQLLGAAMYALSGRLNEPNPINVVAAAPYYSAYEELADYLRSGLFKWAGDAHGYNKEGPYIEMVTSPNNPDGFIREAVVNRAKGMLIHDLAYYWPQYTAITSPADHDIMLFTVSKCTGHAGSRIGWALVKDKDVAKRMVKFMEINTIGVSKEAQHRAATILEIVSASCSGVKTGDLENFFEYSRCLLAERWKKLRDAVEKNGVLHISSFPSHYCNFRKNSSETYLAFAWIKGQEGIDCEKLLREHQIVARNGTKFGSGAEYVRVTLLSTDDEYDEFVQRLSTIKEVAAQEKLRALSL